jgi:tRNA A22 N-methylase
MFCVDNNTGRLKLNERYDACCDDIIMAAVLLEEKHYEYVINSSIEESPINVLQSDLDPSTSSIWQSWHVIGQNNFTTHNQHPAFLCDNFYNTRKYQKQPQR